jgi:4-cresol dehydrogenase (hydroxylating)
MTNYLSELNHIRPQNVSDIQNALTLARKNKANVFVTSGGHNWGYGEVKGVKSDAIHLDLSSMKKILDFNPRTGVVRIEPGVTQGDLETYLKENNLNFYVPNTGAGKRGSILGNALERGFGISPVHDHAESILFVKGILADGSPYESALGEVNRNLAESFTWGVGPQLDKLVTQSSWIVVTEASIQLERKAKCTDILLLPLKEDELATALNKIRDLLQDNSVHIGSIKIFNQKQVSKVKTEEEWFLTMVIYSHPAVRKAYLKIVKGYFKEFQSPKKLILNEPKTRFLKKILELIPLEGAKKFALQLKDFLEMFKLANGGTSEVGYRALDIGFNYQNQMFDMKSLDQKLIWFSPLCVFDGDEALRLFKIINQLNTHEEFRFNTFTWTVLNKRTLAMVIPILFNPLHEEKFWPWYESIHQDLKNMGFIPYRFHVKMMPFLKKNLLPGYFQHVEKFEKAFDPDDIIQSEKYS